MIVFWCYNQPALDEKNKYEGQAPLTDLNGGLSMVTESQRVSKSVKRRTVNALGVLDSRSLPNDAFLALWDSIIIDHGTKDRLLSQAVLNFTLRPRVSRAAVPLHGIILLVGTRGTGKTSLARGLAARVAEVRNSDD